MGFRPTVYRYAREADLAGFVTNDSSGVIIEVEGNLANCERFIDRLKENPPPAAAVREFRSEAISTRGDNRFVITPSAGGAENFISIPPDLDVCADCQRELHTPSDRRAGYPFINCTNCGPRFTITQTMPYDRPGTTMSSFPMCKDCAAEYLDPSDRRFHAQPVACPRCGPRVWLEGRDIERSEGPAAVLVARRLLAAGRTLAVRGLGGFHLVCDAKNLKAIATLRERKKRPAKPFALMCPDLEAVEKLTELSDPEKELLTSVRRPILLARARDGAEDGNVHAVVSPGNGRIGVMLPYTPLHYLLFEPDQTEDAPRRFEALVTTSGNRRDEPICCSNAEAAQRLSGIAHAWLLHDREIHNRADDSIVLYAAGAPRVVRRARGFVPRPIPIDRPGGPTVLGVGAEMKGGFCLLRGEQAYMSQYLGDLSEPGNIDFYREALGRFIRLLGDGPTVLAHDLHPDYFSTLLARSWPRELLGDSTLDLPEVTRTLGVQHHYAHAMSVMAELRKEAPEKALAVILDGTGWGTDGTAWGGELLLLEAHGASWRRLGCLQPFELPGGDYAVREPWRQAFALTRRAFDGQLPEHLSERFARRAGGETELATLQIMVTRGLNSPLTSSAGRLFDAVGCLVAGRDHITFEAQAAMEVEALAMRATNGTDGIERYPFEIRSPLGDAPRRLDPAPAVRKIVADIEAGRPASEVAAAFQAGLAAGLADMAAQLGSEHGVQDVLLSGGCFQNALLLEQLSAALEERGLRWYANSEVPANDAGVSLGQTLAAVRNEES